MYLSNQNKREEIVRDALRMLIIGVTVFLVITGVSFAGMLAHFYLQPATQDGLAAIGASQFEKPVIGFELVITLAVAFLAVAKGGNAIIDWLLPKLPSPSSVMLAWMVLVKGVRAALGMLVPRWSKSTKGRKVD